MPIGAETVVSAALQPLFERLFSVGDYVFGKLTSGGELASLAKTLQKWKRELKMIEAVLEDAEYRQYQDRAVKNWLEKLQDVAYDMEDVLDHFATQLLAPPLEDPQGVLPINSMVTSITNNLSTLFNLAIDRKIQEKIDEISERLDEIKSQTHGLHLSATLTFQQQVLQTEALRDKPESSSLGPKVFGRDKNREDIVSQLLNGDHGDKNYVVIPIVGMGGIGKTTLAQYAYNDEQVRGHFDFKAWVCVSDVFDVKRITMAIVGGEGTFGEFSTLDRAQTQLKEVLTSKRFLIVLDDIWNEEYDAWDQLQAPFQHAPRGSRVIMTTRNMDIARMMNTDPSRNNIINLRGLSNDDCWCVFQQHAGNDSDLAELRDDIIKKCKGLPLSAKALGGLLKKTVDKKRRRMILKNDLWSNESGCLSVLSLSYHYLPFHLKRMFAYCSVFPKDHWFSKKEIILLWMAQDFLSNNEEECMEDLGDIYFDDLRSRSLFEQSPYGNGLFVMHDLIHDLAQWAAGGICYVMGTKDVTKVVNWQRIRHVFVLKDAHIVEDGHTALESQLPMASQLRTFRCDDIMGIENLNLIEHFHYVRALRLASRKIKVLPECIGELQHLRFLRVEFESLEELPKSINKLWNLQTLCLKDCSKLQKIPNIASLGKLRHLRINTRLLEEMPTGLEKLTNLVDIRLINCEKCECLPPLGHLPWLENLRIRGMDGIVEVGPEFYGNLTGTTIPFPTLKRLRFSNMKSWERWLPVDHDRAFRYLEYLEIASCESLQGDVPPHLPSLKTLEISYCRQLKVSVPLQSLTLLEELKIVEAEGALQEEHGQSPSQKGITPFELHYLTKLEIWRSPILISFPDALLLPSLEILDIIGCENMESLPSEMHTFTSLQRLLIWNSPKMQCFPEGGLPKNLKELHIRKLNINQLHSLPSSLCILIIEEMPNLKSIRCSSFEDHTLPPQLEYLRLEKCPKLQFFLQEALHLSKNLKNLSLPSSSAWGLNSLQRLTLKYVNTEEDLSLPSSASQIRIEGDQNVKNLSLVDCATPVCLRVENCPKLESVVGDGNLTSLSYLTLHECPKLHSLPEIDILLNLQELTILNVCIDKPILEWGLHLLTSLRLLTMIDVGSCTDAVEHILGPDDLELPSSLNTLNIGGFQNLKSIRCSTLAHVTYLSIKRCPQFESFADNALPPLPTFIGITECSLIKPRLVRNARGLIQMDGDSWSLC